MRRGTFGCRTLFEQLFLVTVHSKDLASTPASDITGDLGFMIVDGNRLRIGPYRKVRSALTWMNAVAITVKR